MAVGKLAGDNIARAKTNCLYITYLFNTDLIWKKLLHIVNKEYTASDEIIHNNRISVNNLII